MEWGEGGGGGEGERTAALWKQYKHDKCKEDHLV